MASTKGLLARGIGTLSRAAGLIVRGLGGLRSGGVNGLEGLYARGVGFNITMRGLFARGFGGVVEVDAGFLVTVDEAGTNPVTISQNSAHNRVFIRAPK